MKHAVLLVVIILLCSSCGQPRRILPRAGSKSNGGTLVLSIGSDPKSFNPVIAKETSTTAVTGYLFDGLTATDGVTLEIKPALAESWQHDASGTIWTFHLRRNVRWHDGIPFTAADVVFTFNRLIFNPDIPTSSRDIFQIGDKPMAVEKLDDHTVRFILPKPFAPFLRLLGQEIMPKHVLEEAVAAQRFSSTWGINTPPRKIVGTGPFRMDEYRMGERIIFSRNPDYWKKDADGNHLPYLDRIVLTIVADPNMALLKFRAGEIDAVTVRGQDFAVLKPLEHKQNFTLWEIGPSLGSDFLILNQSPTSKLPDVEKAWFSDRRFRQAIAHSIDRQAVIRNVYAGFGIPQDGPLNTSYGFFYNPKIHRYPYNPAVARQLLQEAGFALRQGVLFDRTGKKVVFSLITNSNNNERIQIGSIIQDDLKKLGITVNLLPLDFNTLVTKLTSTRDWEAVIIGLTGVIDPHGEKNVWHSSGQLHVWNPHPGNAATAWEREVDMLFERGAVELDPAKRKQIYNRWQEIACEELPFIYTANATIMYAVRNKFEHLHPSVYGGIFHNIEEISIKQQ